MMILMIGGICQDYENTANYSNECIRRRMNYAYLRTKSNHWKQRNVANALSES